MERSRAEMTNRTSTSHPTIPGATEYVSEFEYSSNGHKRTGKYRETSIDGKANGFCSVQARTHTQQLFIDASELTPADVEGACALIQEAAQWLIANKPEHIVNDPGRPR